MSPSPTLAKQEPSRDHAAPGRAYPGITSKLEAGSAALHLETEVYGAPPLIVTTIFCRGRLIRSTRIQLSDAMKRFATQVAGEAIEFTHKEAQERIRLLVAQKNDEWQRKQGESAPLALLFMKAVDAYASGDAKSSLEVFEMLACLWPDEPRVQRSLQSLRLEEGN